MQKAHVGSKLLSCQTDEQKKETGSFSLSDERKLSVKLGVTAGNFISFLLLFVCRIKNIPRKCRLYAVYDNQFMQTSDLFIVVLCTVEICRSEINHDYTR